MTYSAVLDFLYSQLPMYQRVGKTAFKKDLSNTIALCDVLGNPQDKFQSIHIAGTNGKGSTAHMIAGILQSKGLKVGLYTSPHYRDYRERIKINGKYIPKQMVIDFVEANKSDIESIKPSFFEMTVALAFNHFAQQRVDIAVIETGLGGRLDSTNILNPLLTVITNIGLDHQAILGDTIPEIASEKAGIIKSKTPCVIGIRQEDTIAVFSRFATLHNAELIYAEDQFSTETLKAQIDQISLSVKYQETGPFKIDLPSGVAYNIENCRTAIAAMYTLDQSSDFNISTSDIQNGIRDFVKRTNYIGRWHIKSSNPIVLLDAAHNDDGIRGLFKAISNHHFDQIHIILGMVGDKDAETILKLFPKDARYYFCRPNIPRGKDRFELRSEAKQHGLNGRTYVSCRNALKAAKRAAKANDLILGTGSSFVVAELV